MSHIRISEIMLGIVFAALIIMPFVIFSINNGTIIIEKPYFNDYQQCQERNMQLQRQVQCPPVQCNCGSMGIIWSIIGFLFMGIGGLIYWNAIKQQQKILELKSETRKKNVTKRKH